MKILLVEDDLEISKLLAEFLQENGYDYRLLGKQAVAVG